MIYEIVILAMIAAFLGFRLYSVLGRRAEQGEDVVPTLFERGEEGKQPPSSLPPLADSPRGERAPVGFPAAIEAALREISAADRRFDLLAFLEGAKGAYAMVLDAFWRGDREELAQLCDSDVLEGFTAAIAAREAAGHVQENRLIRIEDVTVHSAVLDGRTARIAVRFVADIASLTRDAAGNVVAGSLDDAVESRDIWTFSRDTSSTDPDWLLDETDEG